MEDGAVGLMRGMMDPKAASGVLYGPANHAFKGPAVACTSYEFETDVHAQDLLWTMSEEATGVKFII